ncbi:F-box/kelch-repeat protein At3g06240 [Eucalyptus grandis]|uniref:F-box/kelch-repeat protein At3g06240 n=1 Tax=Eucalyptus grandis TaxID=71139 RepID=UPI00192EB7B8|nr:F-box/kelch-repeat protein At3g06240 [Eucalyptus grandis]
MAESFAKSHLQRLKAGDLIPSQRIFIGCGYRGHETIDYEALDASEGRVVVPHKIKTIKSGSDCQIVGSCDGLVCFLVSGIFLIYNPTTREYRELPSSNLEEDCQFLDRHNESFYGLGYDPRSDDYIIVEGIHEYAYEFWVAAIFSLKSGSWRRIYFPIEEINESGLDINGNGVYWNGALHWRVYEWGKTGIMSLDLSEEKFQRVLSAPEVDGDGLSQGLGIHGTSLFIYSGCNDNRIHAWITDEYGRGRSWTKWFSVDCLPVSRHTTPLVYTRSGKIVFLINANQVILLNPEDNTYKDYPIGTDSFFGIEYAIYLETLISPYLDGEPSRIWSL